VLKSLEVKDYSGDLGVEVRIISIKFCRNRSISALSEVRFEVLTDRKVAGSSVDEVDFFNLPNPSSCTMALGSTQPPTEMSTRNLSGGKGRQARKADNLTAICEPTV
jgi:hypothetical protein